MPGYSLALQAEIDLTEILEYIAADNPEAAVRMHDDFLACFLTLFHTAPKAAIPVTTSNPGFEVTRRAAI